MWGLLFVDECQPHKLRMLIFISAGIGNDSWFAGVRDTKAFSINTWRWLQRWKAGLVERKILSREEKCHFCRLLLSFVCEDENFFSFKNNLSCCKMSLQKSAWENCDSSFCWFFLPRSWKYHLKHVVKIKGKWAISLGFVNEHILYIPQFHESYKGKFPLASWLNKHLFVEAVRRRMGKQVAQ